MNGTRYVINKYYTMVEIDSNTKVLMEKFMVCSIYVYDESDILEQEVWQGNFNTYKDALSYIEGLLELPKGEVDNEKT